MTKLSLAQRLARNLCANHQDCLQSLIHLVQNIGRNDDGLLLGLECDHSLEGLEDDAPGVLTADGLGDYLGLGDIDEEPIFDTVHLAVTTPEGERLTCDILESTESQAVSFIWFVLELIQPQESSEALKKQLEHERREREAAQRTIAILGGGLDEFEWAVCANNDCVNQVRNKRKNTLYCSDQCKWAVQKRRARAKLKPCQNKTCSEKIMGKRKHALYCSSRCKSAVGVRRHRAKSGGVA